MTVKAKASVFLLLVFAISWPLAIASGLSGPRSSNESGLVLLAFAVSPGLAAIACALLFERGKRRAALALRFRPDIWWLAALLIALLVAAASIVLTLAFGPVAPPSGQQAFGNAARILAIPAGAGLAGIGFAFGAVLARNVILFTLTEEIGWRGYLYALWRPLGFWRSSLATGLVWGIWHWPLIWFFGLNYPNAPAIGLAVFPVYTALLSCVMTLVRDRSGSALATGILHGAGNAFALVFVIVLGDLGWPWGAAGIGAIAALAIAVAAIWGSGLASRSADPAC